MKLKDIKGLLPEKKEVVLSKAMPAGDIYDTGFNSAVIELAEKEIELDVEKVNYMIRSALGRNDDATDNLAQALSKAKDLLKLKGE